MAATSIETDDYYTFFRYGTILRGMAQTKAGQDGRHFVRLFGGTGKSTFADSFDEAVKLIDEHAKLNGS